MKGLDSVQYYFYHALVEIAMMKGWEWNEEVSPAEFLESKESPSEMLYKLKNEDASELTTTDAIALSRGEFPESAIKFFKELYELILVGQPALLYKPEYPLFVSMHSGSSDYFTVSMLQELIKL